VLLCVFPGDPGDNGDKGNPGRTEHGAPGPEGPPGKVLWVRLVHLRRGTHRHRIHDYIDATLTVAGIRQPHCHIGEAKTGL